MFNNIQLKTIIKIIFFFFFITIFTYIFPLILDKLLCGNLLNLYNDYINYYLKKFIFLTNFFFYNSEIFNFFYYDWYIKTIIFYLLNLDFLKTFYLYTLPTSYIYASIILIHIFLLTLTIWTRACGPRTRIDQIMTLTWKEFLINLFFLIILILFIYIFI